MSMFKTKAFSSPLDTPVVIGPRLGMGYVDRGSFFFLRTRKVVRTVRLQSVGNRKTGVLAACQKKGNGRKRKIDFRSNPLIIDSWCQKRFPSSTRNVPHMGYS